MSASESDETKKPELYVDEDWKSRVKAEDAALDQKFQEDKAQEKPEQQPAQPAAEVEQPAPESTADSPPLPPPDFSTLVGMLGTQAYVSLGVIPNPATGQPETQLDFAKQMIDLLAVVEDKTKGNLDKSEQGLLDSTLHQLRMTYVQKSKAAAGGEK